MIDPRLMFELIQSGLRERWQQSEELRLWRAVTTRHPKPYQWVLAALSGLLIAAGQRMQIPSQCNRCWSQECCVPCTF